MFLMVQIAAIWLVLEPAVINYLLSMVDILPQKTPISERLCKQCVMNAVEDESHFLLVCPKYANHRIKITNHLNNNTNFASQSYMSKLQWLLSNEDESVCKDIASFVTICFSLRN